ncbi:Uncharacterised protein [Vibrio cholerae]|nr:Uncharacterised protein [Vibrio cholerae]
MLTGLIIPTRKLCSMRRFFLISMVSMAAPNGPSNCLVLSYAAPDAISDF